MAELCCQCNKPKEANPGSAKYRYICRLCLMRAEDLEPIFIYAGDKTLANKILACTGVEVDENAVDGPTNICMPCKMTVYKNYQFWELCQRNNEIIQRRLNSTKSNTENESPPPRNGLRLVIRQGPSSSTSQSSPAKRKREPSGRRKSTRSNLEESTTSASEVSWDESDGDDENNDLDEDVDEVMPFRQLAYETDTQDEESPKRKKPLVDTNGGQIPSSPRTPMNAMITHQRQPSGSGDSGMPAERRSPVPEVSFDCDFCSESFPYRLKFNQHIKLCHADRQDDLTCKVCRKFFVTTRELSGHCTEKHPTKSSTPVVECELCQRTFTSKPGLFQHFKTIMHRAACGECVYPKRRRSSSRSTARRASSDDYSGYQSDTESFNPYDHVSYNEIQTYDCDYCDERFDDRQALADHTGVRPCRVVVEPLDLDLLLKKIDLDELLQPINNQAEILIIEPTIEIVDLT